MMMGGWGYGPYGSNFTNGGYWWVGLIVMLVEFAFWAAIIFLAVRFIKHLAHRNSYEGSSNDRAMDILSERYARGEIDTDEFQHRKRELLG